MRWILSAADSHLKAHAEVLFDVLKNTEDLNLITPVESLTLNHRLKEDIGMDSIQTVSVLYELEEKYPHLDEQMVSNWQTIRDILLSMGESK